MKFVAISDTHNRFRELSIPDADVIICAGDSTSTGTVSQIRAFCEWYGNLPHKHKILIAGNHDWGFQDKPNKCKKLCEENGITYLQDSGCEIDGIKIWGSPQTPEFCDWAFNCWRTEKEYALDKIDEVYQKGYKFIGTYWDMIPSDTDILVTHGPPFGILDQCPNSVGCQLLFDKVLKISPTYHIFGHIHEGSGSLKLIDTTFINASVLDGRYNLIGSEIKVWEI